MAKSDVDRRTGKYKPPIDRLRRGIFNKMCDISEKNRTDAPKQVGIRQKIIKVYEEHGNIEEAYAELEQVNERIGVQAFSKKNVDERINEWIDKNKQSLNKQDDDAR